jgi:hypothetical protein
MICQYSPRGIGFWVALKETLGRGRQVAGGRADHEERDFRASQRSPRLPAHGDGNGSPANEPRQRDRSWLPFGLSRLGGKRNPFPARGRGGRARPRHRRRRGAGLSPRGRARKEAGVGGFPRAEHSQQCREPAGARIVLPLRVSIEETRPDGSVVKHSVG